MIYWNIGIVEQFSVVIPAPFYNGVNSNRNPVLLIPPKTGLDAPVSKHGAGSSSPA